MKSIKSISTDSSENELRLKTKKPLLKETELMLWINKLIQFIALLKSLKN